MLDLLESTSFTNKLIISVAFAHAQHICLMISVCSLDRINKLLINERKAYTHRMFIRPNQINGAFQHRKNIYTAQHHRKIS